MGEGVIHNPHDQLFKDAFSRIENAIGFFQSYLPVELQERLDWGSMQLQPGSYIDEMLRSSESDLLYTVEIDKRPTLLYCLFGAPEFARCLDAAAIAALYTWDLGAIP
jgi:predicted transposase YdaD